MTDRLRVILLAVLLATFAVGLSGATLWRGEDGRERLTLDEDEVETLGVRMRMLSDEIARLKAERKTDCGLI